MKSKLAFLLGILLILAAAMMSCGKKQGVSEAPQSPGNQAAEPVDASTAGSITGTVQLEGKPPRMKVINMAAEPKCAQEHSTPVLTQEVVPGENGTLQNVVVYLQGDFSRYKFEEPQKPAIIDQEGCMYDPHVLALRTGQSLQVINSDPVTHNIHPVPKDNREWNQSQPPGAAPIVQSFAREEVAIPVKCNVHPWMKAYIAVRLPFADLIGGLGALGTSASTAILSASEAVLVGAKDFRPPAGLGSVQSNFCYIAIFSGRSVPDLHKYLSSAPVSSALGNPIWQWSAPPQEGHPTPYTFYIAQAGSYILISSDLQDLQEASANLISSGEETPKLADIRDWKLVSSQNYWGYRRYRHTPPYGEAVASGLAAVTPSADDLIFFVELKQKTWTLRLLAADDTAAAKLNQSITKTKGALPPMKPVSTGAWEAAIPFGGDQATVERIFNIMGLFGFAVYL